MADLRKKGTDLPDFLNPESGQPAQAPRAKAPAQSAAQSEAQRDLGDAGDILLGSGGPSRRMPDADIDESFEPENKGKAGLIVFIVIILAAAAGIGYILTNDKMKQDLECFFSGEVEKCKTAEKSAQEAKWRDVDAITQNRYASTSMMYNPQDAKVILTQLKWTESVEDYVGRVKQGKADKRGEPERIDIPNRTTSLKERELVENLPLQDLPILEKSTEAVSDDTLIYTYAYEASIEKEGYYPRGFLFMTDDVPLKVPDGVQGYKFENAGPGVYIASFGGADLMPKPETARPKMVEALIAIRCLKDSADGKKLSEDDMAIQVMSIKQGKGFGTDEMWTEVETALQAKPEVWAEMQTEVAAGACE